MGDGYGVGGNPVGHRPRPDMIGNQMNRSGKMHNPVRDMTWAIHPD